MSTRREITRAATVAEIKATALALMREHGTTDIRFADIARTMSMTAPALYRYFSGRDELLTAMLADAFTSLADCLEKSLTDVDSDDPHVSISAVCSAYRQWAGEDPTRFALVFGFPVPGYIAAAEGPHCDAGQRAFQALAAPVLRATQSGIDILPLGPAVTAPLREMFGHKGSDLTPATMQALMHAWASVHGFICLEMFGHLAWCSPEAIDDLFDGLVDGLATYVGIPAGGATGSGPHYGSPDVAAASV